MAYIKPFILFALLTLSAPVALAAMVGTAELTAPAPSVAMTENLDQRDHVRQQLVERGVDPADAAHRVEQMTDRQIAALQGEIDSLPAGGRVSTTNLLLIIIILILIL